MKLLVAFCLFAFLSLGQISPIIKLHEVQSIHFKPKPKKSNVLSLKCNNFIKFTASTDFNKKAFKANQDFKNNLSNAMRYDFRTKFYITKRLSLIMRTQVSVVSQVASLGLSWKLK